MELIPNGFDIIEAVRRLYHFFDRDSAWCSFITLNNDYRSVEDAAPSDRQSSEGRTAFGTLTISESDTRSLVFSNATNVIMSGGDPARLPGRFRSKRKRCPRDLEAEQPWFVE